MLYVSRLSVAGLAIAVVCTIHATPCLAYQVDTDTQTVLNNLRLLASDERETRQQALQSLADSRDGRLVEFLELYNQGAVFLWHDQLVVCPDTQRDASGADVLVALDPLTRQPAAANGKPLLIPAKDKNLVSVSPSGRERRTVLDVIHALEIWMEDDEERRIAAIRSIGDSRDVKSLAALQELARSHPPSAVAKQAHESILLIKAAGIIPGQVLAEQQAAIHDLGELCTARAVPLLKQLLRDPSQAELHNGCREAIEMISSYQSKIRVLQNIFNGISLSSILILIALGLSIIFGQMGVINMAHGELMMIGAYATFEMQLLFGHSHDNPSNWYYVAALPVAFLSSALVGILIERLVVRHLYGRPLDTLLATWGVSLVLIQLARVKYGDNIGVNSPTWLVGRFEVVQDLIVPYNRAFILLLSGACVAFLYWLFRFTRMGLRIRATVQARETAASHGVNTRLVDSYTFGLGSGLAGIAGYAWTVVGGVTPDMGQNHIVDSFLVVVTGGVGKLSGAVCAGLGIGTLNKILEPLTFGEGLLVLGLISALASWIVVVVQAFRERKQLGWLALIPIVGPLLVAYKHRTLVGIRTGCTFYGIGLTGVILSLLGNRLAGWFNNGPIALSLAAVLNEPIQAIWAKVLILGCVVLFIQWRPMGLFPPKGRLADV
jgi:urea transport system permease protein